MFCHSVVEVLHSLALSVNCFFSVPIYSQLLQGVSFILYFIHYHFPPATDLGQCYS